MNRNLDLTQEYRDTMDIMLAFRFGFMVLKATFNNISIISWPSVLLVAETGVAGDNHRPVAGH